MTDDMKETKVLTTVSAHFAGQPPDTPEMLQKRAEARKRYIETGTIPPDLPDLLVEEEDGSFWSVKETARDRIAALSNLAA